MKNELTSLEKAVLEKLLVGDIPLLNQIRTQLTRCAVAKRELTGYGFYTTFDVPKYVSRIIGLDIKFGDVTADIPGLKNGAGFLLYIKDGVLQMLEGYCYDEVWPSSVDKFDLKYVKGEARDWVELKQKLGLGLRK